MPPQDLPSSIRSFLSRYVRSIEQLEILLLCNREPDVTWSPEQVYDAILSTPSSVKRWLDELASQRLLEKTADTVPGYRKCADAELSAEVASLAEIYRTTPVRVIETIYKRDSNAAQSFADAFKLKTNDPSS